MSREHEQHDCGCGPDCECHDVTENVVREEEPVQIEEVKVAQPCGCGCGCH